MCGYRWLITIFAISIVFLFGGSIASPVGSSKKPSTSKAAVVHKKGVAQSKPLSKIASSTASIVSRKTSVSPSKIGNPVDPVSVATPPKVIVSELRDDENTSIKNGKSLKQEVPLYEWVESIRTDKFSGFTRQYAELFPPKYYNAGQFVVTKKPWSLSSMTKAARGLIARELLQILTPHMVPAPQGWQRQISLEQERPDGYPALAFVHVNETHEPIVQCAYSFKKKKVLVRVMNIDKIDRRNHRDLVLGLEKALGPYVKYESEKEPKGSRRIYKFYMDLRHDLYCAQLTSSMKSLEKATIIPRQKTTYIGRIYFGRLRPAPTVKDDTSIYDYYRDWYRGYDHDLLGSFRDEAGEYDHYGFLQQSRRLSDDYSSHSLLFNESHLDSSVHSFLEEPSSDTTPIIPIVALTTEGKGPIRMQGEGDPSDREYLTNAINEFGLAEIRSQFPCPEIDVLTRPGMGDSCIYLGQQLSPNNIALDDTREQMIIQCMARYPTKSWIIWKRLTPSKEEQKKIVKEEWVIQFCTPKGWSNSAVLENKLGEEKFKSCSTQLFGASSGSLWT